MVWDYYGYVDSSVSSVKVRLGSGISDEIPVSYSLEQNVPNPFGKASTIRFSLPYEELVTLEVFDIDGKQVQTLVNDNKTAGYHTVTWDASGLSQGIYFYKLTAGGFTSVKKGLKLK